MTYARPANHPYPPRRVPPRGALGPPAAVRLFSRPGLVALVAAALGVSVLMLAISPTAGVVAITLFVLLVLGLRDYRLLVVALFGVMPFQQSVFGGAVANVSPADCVAAVLSLALLREATAGRLRGGPALWPVVIFLAIGTMSSALDWDGRETLVSLGRMYTITLLPMLVFANLDRRPITPRRCFAAYLAAATALAGMVVVTFALHGAGAAMYSVEMNKNSLGPTFGVGLVIAIGLILTHDRGRRRGRRIGWPLLAALVACGVGLLLSFSRGAWVSTAAGVLFLLVITRHYRAALYGGVPLALALGIVWQFVPDKVADYALDFNSRQHTVQTRFESIGEVMAEFDKSPLIGVGVGLRKSLEPHNVVVLTLGEEGMIGLAAFLIMFGSGFYTFRLAWRRLAADPAARSTLVVCVSVFMVSSAHGLMDVYWRRGVGAAGWACVGMAVAMMAGRAAGSRGEPRGEPRGGRRGERYRHDRRVPGGGWDERGAAVRAGAAPSRHA